uniref:Uncharacterized protein n=1 Tax=Rangifer tarandus platyrhynchus TaxID=3082113 RepID=A0ACB0DU19_RANTA|nr:unnamed protein product [Rangifer tarandus platyrhynchus]
MCCTLPPLPATAALRGRAASPRPWPPAAGREPGARTPRLRAVGAGRCWRGCSRAWRLQSPSSQLGSRRTREQQVAEDIESSAPTCGTPTRAGAALGATVRLRGRLSTWAVPFVYTPEDTQLRKHRRRHTVGNGEICGAPALDLGECRGACSPHSPDRSARELGLGNLSGIHWGGNLAAASVPELRIFSTLPLSPDVVYVFFHCEFLIYELRDNWVQPMPLWLQLHFG